MKIILKCSECGIGFDTNIFGKDALEFIKKYGTIINGTLYVSRCACGGDMLIKTDDKLAEI